jgi:hypothetical protein
MSGGIDSPVAAWHMMKRGCRVDMVHFHSYPILSRASQEKVREIAALLTPRRTNFAPGGKVAYVFDPERVTDPGGGTPAEAPQDLPAQEGFEQTEVGGQGFEFEVKGPADGVRNGGLTIEATYGNVDGISPNAAATLILDYCGPGEHPGAPRGDLREGARCFNQRPR